MLNSQAVAALSQAVLAYCTQLDHSQLAASSASWKAAHHHNKLAVWSAALTGLES
jgi:hypothetical protein